MSRKERGAEGPRVHVDKYGSGAGPEHMLVNFKGKGGKLQRTLVAVPGGVDAEIAWRPSFHGGGSR